MVKDAALRKRKYDASLDPKKIARNLARLKPGMVEQESVYLAQIADVERKVKHVCEAAGVPSYQVAQYINVGRQCYSLAKRFSGATRDGEAQNVVDHWAARGLNGTLLQQACVAGGCHPTAPPGPPTVPVVCFFGYVGLRQSTTIIYFYPLHEYYPSATERDGQGLMWPGTFKEMKVNVSTNTRNGPTLFLLRVNGANSALTVTIPAGATGLFTVTKDVAIALDDLVNFMEQTTGTSGSITLTPALKFEVG